MPFLGLLGGFLRAIFLPLLDPSLWPGLAVLAFLAFGYGWYKGDSHGDRQCEQRIQRDKAEQERKIKEEGDKTWENLERFRREKESDDELAAKLADEAGKDPNAGRTCLGADGLRRINRVKGKP